MVETKVEPAALVMVLEITLVVEVTIDALGEKTPLWKGGDRPNVPARGDRLLSD
jgi:hypothetical protein